MYAYELMNHLSKEIVHLGSKVWIKILYVLEKCHVYYQVCIYFDFYSKNSNIAKLLQFKIPVFYCNIY